jgi:predicted nucleic acid-binding protein
MLAPSRTVPLGPHLQHRCVIISDNELAGRRAERGDSHRPGVRVVLVRAARGQQPDPGTQLGLHTLAIQAVLWRGGQMRSVGLPGLLVAAVAEREHVTMLHYDADYEIIAKVTGQAIRWVVPRGSVP